MDERSVDEALVALVEALEVLELPYAIGGALAMGMVGFARATADIDVLVAVPQLSTEQFVEALGKMGCQMGDAQRLEPMDALRWLSETGERGMARVHWCGVPIEIFAPRVPLQHEILRRRWRGEVVEGHPCWLTTAEDLILLKMIFGRPKDILDVQRLLVVRQDDLDFDYVAEWSERTLDPQARADLLQLIADYTSSG